MPGQPPTSLGSPQGGINYGQSLPDIMRQYQGSPQPPNPFFGNTGLTPADLQPGGGGPPPQPQPPLPPQDPFAPPPPPPANIQLDPSIGAPPPRPPLMQRVGEAMPAMMQPLPPSLQQLSRQTGRPPQSPYLPGQRLNRNSPPPPPTPQL